MVLFFFYFPIKVAGENPRPPCHPGKNGNCRQMDACFPPYPVEELNSLVFGPKQLLIGGREGAYIFCSMEIVV